jgi:hypothetical protein
VIFQVIDFSFNHKSSEGSKGNINRNQDDEFDDENDQDNRPNRQEMLVLGAVPVEEEGASWKYQRPISPRPASNSFTLMTFQMLPTLITVCMHNIGDHRDEKRNQQRFLNTK